MARVTKIPATITQFTASPINSTQKRRVAAYARVSTDLDEQLTSYEAQLDYYTGYIKSRSDWQYVNVYSDEGITGTNTRHREGFNRMITDALSGKIDLIITKSVSRFARNTVDSLTTIRKLKENGIECYFEKENIWTFDSKGELLITIMSSLAQEESRSISENCTWGQRKRFADGKVTVPFSRFLGYDRGEDGSLVVNQEQAITVRRIYAMFLQGMTAYGIAAQLTKEGILSPGGKSVWKRGTVMRILTNEKYKGDALLQKSFTVDFLTKKVKMNEGEVPQYYVENDHEAIISPEIFEMVQLEIEKRGTQQTRYSGVSIFASKIQCGECGNFYGAKVWHSNDKYKRVIYRCNRKFEDNHICETPHITESEIRQAFIQAVNILFAERDEVITAVNEVITTICDTSRLNVERDNLQCQLELIVAETQNLIARNARTAMNQDEYNRKHNELTAKYQTLKERHSVVSDKISDSEIREKQLMQFAETIKKQPCIITEFDTDLWCCLLDKIIVNTEKQLTVCFKNGSQINV